MKFVAVLVLLALAQACLAQLQWEKVNPLIFMSTINAITTDGKGNYVMVQADQNLHTLDVSYSTDELTWTPSAFPKLNWVTSCTAFYANNQFIIFVHDTAYASPDGQTWSVLGTNPEIYDPVVGLVGGAQPIFLTVSNTSTSLSLVSNDGMSWTQYSFPATAWGLIAISSVFVMYGDDGYYYSADGIKWQPLDNSNFQSGSVQFYQGNGDEILAFQFLEDSYIYSTTDYGQTWNMVNTSATWYESVIDLFYFGSYGALVSDPSGSNLLYTSSDLVNWQQVTIPGIDTVNTFLIVGTDLFAIGQIGYAVTTDLQSWNTPNIGITEDWNQIFVLPDSTFVFEGDFNFTSLTTDVIYVSSQDGQTYTFLPEAPSLEFYDQQWEQDGTFYFLDHNIIYQTTDFQSWTSTPVNAPCNLTNLVYGNDLWIGVCQYRFQVQLYAVDNTQFGTWREVYDIEILGIPYIAFGNGVFVLYTGEGVTVSENGTNWQNSTVKVYIADLTYLGDLFFLVEESSLLVSSDGILWTNATVPVNSVSLTYVQTSPPSYVAYGSDGVISVSTDGFTWSPPATYSVPTINYLADVAYNGKYWVAIDSEAGIYFGN